MPIGRFTVDPPTARQINRSNHLDRLINQALGFVIRDERIERNLSLEDVTTALNQGFRPSQLAKFERGTASIALNTALRTVLFNWLLTLKEKLIPTDPQRRARRTFSKQEKKFILRLFDKLWV